MDVVILSEIPDHPKIPATKRSGRTFGIRLMIKSFIDLKYKPRTAPIIRIAMKSPF